MHKRIDQSHLYFLSTLRDSIPSTFVSILALLIISLVFSDLEISVILFLRSYIIALFFRLSFSQCPLELPPSRGTSVSFCLLPMISEFLVFSLYSLSHSSSFSSCTISWSKPNYFRFLDSFCSVLIPRRLLAILAYEYFGFSESFSCRSWYRCIFGGEFIGVGFLCTFCFSYLLA